MNQQITDGKSAFGVDEIELAILLDTALLRAQRGKRTVREPHRDAEAARQGEYAVAVIGVLVRHDYSGEIGRLEACTGETRHGFAERKAAVEHEARAAGLDDERVALAAAAERSEAHHP